MSVREWGVVERIPAEILKADQFLQQCGDDLQIFHSSNVELLVVCLKRGVKKT